MTQGYSSTSLVRGSRLPVYETWVRPSDWLAMPAVTNGSNVYNMLFAVWNGLNTNYVRIDPVGTAYTVDWGDGSAPENFASGAAASHNFSWSGCSSSTLTTMGYRQAMVVVTPQGAGAFSGFSAILRHASAGAGSSTGLLDFEFSAPTSTLPILGTTAGSPQQHLYCQHFKAHSTTTTTSWQDRLRNLTSVRLIEGLQLSTPTNISSLFNTCSSLLSGPEMNTSSCTTFTSAFTSCTRMVSVPNYDYSAATTLNSMFNSCSSLRSIGAINSGICSIHDSMFSSCPSLTTVTAIDLTSSTSASSMFSGCVSLRSIPALNTPLVTNMTSMFSGCASMVTAPTMTTTNVLLMTSMFQSCTSLTSVPSYDTSKVTGMSSMFSSCSSLRTVPLLDSSKATTMAGMFSGCGALQSVPAFDLTVCTNTSTMFNSCPSLTSVTALVNTSAITNVTNMFASCTSLQVLSINFSGVVTATTPFASITSLRSVVLTGMRFGFTVASNLLEATALDALYTSLGTASGAQVVTVTSNPGTATDTPSIATAKGWTVTGS